VYTISWFPEYIIDVDSRWSDETKCIRLFAQYWLHLTSALTCCTNIVIFSMIEKRMNGASQLTCRSPSQDAKMYPPYIFSIQPTLANTEYYFTALQNVLKPKLITKAPPEICDFCLPSNCQSACFLSVSLFNTMVPRVSTGIRLYSDHPRNSFLSSTVSSYSTFPLFHFSFYLLVFFFFYTLSNVFQNIP